MDLESVKSLVENDGGDYEVTVDTMPDKFIEPIVMQGLKIDHIERGHIVCSFTVPPRLVNNENSLHGGAMATLVDIVGSAVIYTVGATFTGVSVEINVSYLDCAYVGSQVVMGTNEGIEQLEAGLGGVQEGLHQIELGMADRLLRVEETRNRFSDVLPANQENSIHEHHHQDSHEGGRQNLNFRRYFQEIITEWFIRVNKIFEFQNTLEAMKLEGFIGLLPLGRGSQPE